MLALTSCVFDKAEDEPADTAGGSVPFVLRISTLANSAGAQSSPVVESIRSLRVIIIDNQGVLEVNETVDLEKLDYASGAFEYIYSTTLNVNTKRVYLIANEESVSDVGITDYTDLPSGIPVSTLPALLNHFKAESAESEQRMGRTFEKVLNRIYFKADYSDKVTDGKIYLPYSSFYELSVMDFGTARVERPLYLVPAATKIDFKFVNYRRFGVKINDIEVASLNRHNYLNAQLDGTETTRIFGTSEMWWVDWMQQVAVNSHSAEDLEAFNEKWGWIKRYGMPVDETPVLYGLNKWGEEWKLGAMVDKNNPDRISFGPFYLPESKNPASGVSDESQRYCLNFRIHDDSKDDDVYLEGYEIDTLKTLFRGTHIIMEVELYDQAVEVYAEIAPWEFQPFWGYVQQEDDD